jgi:hypothetical protein
VNASPKNDTDAVPPQLSVAVTLAAFGAGTSFAHWTVIVLGQVNKGGVLSNTEIVCVHEAELPQASTAL